MPSGIVITGAEGSHISIQGWINFHSDRKFHPSCMSDTQEDTSNDDGNYTGTPCHLGFGKNASPSDYL